MKTLTNEVKEMIRWIDGLMEGSRDVEMEGRRNG